MGFSIYYRTTETMQPALAFEIKQRAAQLVEAYLWTGCEPVTLTQQTSGYLFGSSKPNFLPPETDSTSGHHESVPDGSVLTLADVLSGLAREFDVVWNIGHDYESEPIGQISGDPVDSELLEELETLGSIGDLLEDAFDVDLTDDESLQGFAAQDEEPEESQDEVFGDDLHQKKLAQWTSAEFGADPPPSPSDEDLDDDGPRVIKFPGV